MYIRTHFGAGCNQWNLNKIEVVRASAFAMGICVRSILDFSKMLCTFYQKLGEKFKDALTARETNELQCEKFQETES